jgi:cytochrome c-type biogenesis protein CcmE
VTASGAVQNGILVAQTVSFAQPPPATSLEVEGTISSFVNIANFVVSGQAVNASQATISNGSASDLANGRKVQVRGVLQNGVLVATSVQIEDASQSQEVSIEGLISNFVSVSNFVVAGRKVDASHAKFDGGTAANLANGKKVQVQGTLSGQTVIATEVEFDD